MLHISQRGGNSISFFKKIVQRVKAPNATVLVTLDKPIFSCGGDLTGKLAITSSEEFDATELRVEVQAVETTKAHCSGETFRVEDREVRCYGKDVSSSTTTYSQKAQVHGALHLAEGYKGEFPFNLSIPPNVLTTYHGKNASHIWSLKGVIAVKGRPDVISHMVEVTVTPAVKT